MLHEPLAAQVRVRVTKYAAPRQAPPQRPSNHLPINSVLSGTVQRQHAPWRKPIGRCPVPPVSLRAPGLQLPRGALPLLFCLPTMFVGHSDSDSTHVLVPVPLVHQPAAGPGKYAGTIPTNQPMGLRLLGALCPPRVDFWIYGDLVNLSHGDLAILCRTTMCPPSRLIRVLPLMSALHSRSSPFRASPKCSRCPSRVRPTST